LQDENMWVRYAAALALGRIGDARAKAPLYQCLKEEEGPVQIAAIGALREMQDQDLIATLAPLQQSPDNEIRQVVAETIAYFESLNG
jgi:HEAT repeat protein